MITSVIIAIFKREINVHHVDTNERELSLSFTAAYKIIWKMLKIKYMRRLATIWLTAKVSEAKEEKQQQKQTRTLRCKRFSLHTTKNKLFK
jgi:hypothetical protein